LWCWLELVRELELELELSGVLEMVHESGLELAPQVQAVLQLIMEKVSWVLQVGASLLSFTLDQGQCSLRLLIKPGK
jgi:hypothetical protein